MLTDCYYDDLSQMVNADMCVSCFPIFQLDIARVTILRLVQDFGEALKEVNCIFYSTKHYNFVPKRTVKM